MESATCELRPYPVVAWLAAERQSLIDFASRLSGCIHDFWASLPETFQPLSAMPLVRKENDASSVSSEVELGANERARDPKLLLTTAISDNSATDAISH